MKNLLKFETELTALLTALINKHSLDNECNTPDFVIARYLCDCLRAWTVGTNHRDDWYGVRPVPGQSQTPLTELGEK